MPPRRPSLVLVRFWVRLQEAQRTVSGFQPRYGLRLPAARRIHTFAIWAVPVRQL